MSYDNESEIICPYCDKQAIENVCEYKNHYFSNDEVRCDNCKKDFIVTAELTTVYFTSKKDCGDGKHDFGEAEIYYDRTVDRSYKYIQKKCKNCDAEDFKREKIKSI